MNNNLENNYCEIKNIKLKLHLKYIVVICCIIISGTIVAATVSNSEFVGQVSLASTITSIILSVLAIIVTLIGEMKSDNAKDKILTVSDNLTGITESIEKSTKKLKSISEINIKINKLDDIINSIDNVNIMINDTNIKMDSLLLTDKNKDNLEENTKNINYVEIFKDITSYNNNENEAINYQRKMICSMVYYYKSYKELYGKIPEVDSVKCAIDKVEKGINKAFYAYWGLSFIFFIGINRNNQELRDLINFEMEETYKEYKKILDDYLNIIDKY